METFKSGLLANLRHELRTPVNHILGYSELLIEDAAERHLEALIPTFQQIQSGGRQLLDAIQTALGEKSSVVQELDLHAFRENLCRTAAGILEKSTLVSEDLESSHKQTLADLAAISWALRSLMDFPGHEGAALARKPPDGAGRIQPSREGILARSKARGGRILIADDEPANRDLLRRRLECEGHHVVEAKNGLEVLALLKEQACDLVLLDIMMPDMDGFQTLASLKRDSQLRELPVIMISALDELRSVVRCIEMGADDYLPKPFNRVLLRARIGASLEKKWLRDRERCKTEELQQALGLLEKARAQLDVQASEDALTGLANRRSVDSHLELHAERETPFTVLYIDLNGFKKINDTYGHQAGDDLLRQVGGRLRLAFRSTDIIGRWGGDEFVALMESSLTEGQSKISRITELLSDEFAISVGGIDQRISIGAAIGIATWQSGETVTEVLQRADAAMYKQKARNK